MNDNVILIGMPGAGKSTIGIVLAKVLGCDFIDSDLLIQKQEKKLLWQIMQEQGIQRFNEIEEQVNSTIQSHHTVIATGGSAVYSPKSMAHLSEIGTIVYLRTSYEVLKNRLGDLNKRGVVLRPGQTLEDLYQERVPLYEQYARITVPNDDFNISRTVAQIVSDLQIR